MNIPDFKLERYFARYEFDVDYLLCSSDCESMTVEELLALEPGAEEGLRRQWLGYTESQGSPSLRREISRIYDAINPDDVLVFSGAEEAIFIFMHAYLSAGDHIIVHWPCYQSLYEVAGSIGCQVTRWQGRAYEGWALDLNELKDSLQPNTKAIILNCPHNPTGYLMSQEDFKALNDLANERGIVLFSDEVYRESEYNLKDRLPAACDLGEQAISLGVTSKSYGLPGLRIGWIATHNQELYARMASLKDYTTICNSAPSEFLAEVAMRHREELSVRSIKTITHNLSILDDFFERYGKMFQWQRPKAGPIAFPRLLGHDIETFCDDLVNEANVLLLPGSLYNHSGNHFRIGFGRRNLPEAVERLKAFVEVF
jgi:aspartate/methionine/tyrosine aminotransferase